VLARAGQGFPSRFRVVTAVRQSTGALLLLDVRGAFWGAAALVDVLVGVALRPPFLR